MSFELRNLTLEELLVFDPELETELNVNREVEDAMIVLGLVFRSLCLRLTREKSRKKLVRQGLKQIAAHMDMATRSMSNELELPNSPKTVMRTYSGRSRLAEPGPDFSKEKRDSLWEIAFSNNLRETMEQREKEAKQEKAVLEKRDSLKLIMFGEPHNKKEPARQGSDCKVITGPSVGASSSSSCQVKIETEDKEII